MARWSLRRFLALTGTVLASMLALAPPAKASPIMVGNVTVTSHETGATGDPNVDVVAIGAGVELTCCAGGNIPSNIFLTGESIDIGSSTILFTIHGGGDPTGHTAGYLDTGYNDGEFTFSGIGFNTPGHIANVSFSLPGATATDFTGLPAVLNWTNTSIFVRLAGIGILSSPSDLGQLQLNITTVDDPGPGPGPGPGPSPVPEPASILLLGGGLSALYFRRRKNVLR